MEPQKPVITHYYTYKINSGGPLAYINFITKSELKMKYQFKNVFQNFKAKGLINRILLIIKMKRQLEFYKPDILHIHGVQSEGFNGYIAGKLAKCKKILLTVHGLQSDNIFYPKYKIFLFKHIIEPFVIKKCDYVYCVCKYMENRDIITKNAKKLIPAIYNSVHNKKIIDEGKYEKFTIAIVGRVTLEKGMKRIVKIIKKTQDDIQYLIIGEGEYKEKMMNILKEEINMKKVIFLGYREDAINYIKQSHILLSASYHENLPITILEAISLGVVCLVTDVGGNNEIIKDGYNGILINDWNEEYILSKLRELRYNNSLYNTLSNNAIYTYENNFSPKIILNKIDNMYENILQNRI